MENKQLATELSRLKESVDLLEGKRGNNRSLKQSDLRAVASYGMKSPTTSSGTLAEDYAALREDVAKLYELLAKASNLFGTAGK